MKAPRRSGLNLAALIVIATAGVILSRSPAAAAEGCCYSACMKYCTQENGFPQCHPLCNRDCDAC